MLDPHEALHKELSDRYELQDVLGEGGMGTVYLARDRKHDRPVAIKTVHPDQTSEDVRKRFEREISITSHLQHPHILPLLDSGVAGETLYYVMPHVEGESLRDRIDREGRLPLEEALQIAREVASALGYAHGRGVVHRDIKPGNIMRVGGSAVVTDFGIAKAIAEPEGVRLTQTGLAIGSPAYMSPEQSTGSRAVDGRSDIYSLGCVLYEMLVGEPPFTGQSSLAVIARSIREEAPPLRSKAEGVPPEVEGAVHKALAKAPENRFETAEAFTQALTGVREAAAAQALTAALSGHQAGAPGFWSELRRRKVYNTGVLYALGAWVLVQVAETTFPYLGLSDWAITVVIVSAIVGFPVAVALAWAFDMTPGGVERARSLETAAEPPGVERNRSERPVSEPLPHSIAVLPFINMSGEPENEYFSDGITEDLIAHLARLRDLKVISRASVMQYKGRPKGMREMASELGVATLLEGSVRRAGGHVRIVAKLVDARSDHHLWSETYDRELEDIFEIQADVAQRIAASLQAELSPRERERIAAAPTRDLAAYDLYLKGRHEWNRRTDASLARSLDHLKRAVAADPGFALALAGLADSYVTLGIYGARSPHEVMPRARAAAEKALGIDEEQAEALTALACVRSVYEWDWLAAEEEYRRAIDLSPNYPLAHHWYAANFLMPLRRFEEARGELERAQELDPLAPSIAASFAVLELFEGRLERAAEACRQVVASSPGFWLAHYFLGCTFQELGSNDEAIASLEKARALSANSVDAAAALGQAYAAAGRADDARAVLHELLERAAHDYVSPMRLAQTHLGMGETEEALSCLERAVEERAAGLVWLDVQPVFKGLRGDPRFEAVRRTVFE